MATIGTRIHSFFTGELVGTDEFSNRYYKSKKAKLHGRQRRWVIYKGRPEASKVPAEWHSWLHHTTEEPLTDAAAQSKRWQQPHQENVTGTINTYRPQGHDLSGGKRAAATGDYEPWQPE